MHYALKYGHYELAGEVGLNLAKKHRWGFKDCPACVSMYKLNYESAGEIGNFPLISFYYYSIYRKIHPMGVTVMTLSNLKQRSDSDIINDSS